MLYVPLEIENNLTLDALVDSAAFVSAIAKNDLSTIQEKAPNNILKIDHPPNFQIQVANGQLKKPLSTATLKSETGDNTFAEHFIVMKKATGPIIGLRFMRNNSVVIDTKLISLDEQLHQKESHHKPRKIKVSLTNLDSPSRKKHYSDI